MASGISSLILLDSVVLDSLPNSWPALSLCLFHIKMSVIILGPKEGKEEPNV